MPHSPDHATAALSLPLSSIIIPDRMRRDTKDHREYIENELLPSIAEHGLIQPINVTRLSSPVQGKNIQGLLIQSEYLLVAGWSRLTSFSLLSYEEIPCNYSSDTPEHERLARELEENIRRNPMSWQDIAVGIARTHNAKLAECALENHSKNLTGSNRLTWGQSQTGHLVGTNVAHVSESLMLAKLILSGDKEIIDAPNPTEAKRILLLRKEDKAKSILLARQKASVAKVTDVIKRTTKLDTAEKNAGSVHPARQAPSILGQGLSSPSPSPVQTIELSKMLFNMSCTGPQLDGSPSWFDQASPECIDLIYTDHPYGIDMDNLDDMVNVERVADEHDVEENLDQMPLFLKGAYKVLKDKSYLLFFMDLKHWEKLRDWAEEVGFSVQPYPVIWNKLHSCKCRAAGQWWTKSHETVMVCRKGKATLGKAMTRSVFDASGAAERKLQNNPFSKPFAFSQWLLEPVLVPGMTVLDCYAGEGSLLRAAVNLGANIVGVEKSTKHFPRLVEHMKELYKEITNGKVEFV